MHNVVYFAIPVAPRTSDAQWARTNELLFNTLRSLRAQRSQEYVAVVCGHERPECIDSMPESSVVFLQATFDRPTSDKAKRRDKRSKRRLIAEHVRQLGGGYFTYLDADDLVDENFVNFILTDDNKRGYIVTHGYVYDYTNQVIAPVPGAWNKEFHQVCGSSASIFMTKDDLPFAGEEPNDKLYFKIRNHLSFDSLDVFPDKLQAISFPAMVYVLNHSENLSDILVRTPERSEQLISGIGQRSLPNKDEILGRFGFNVT